MDFREKLEILADAAKYDASCASSGARPRSSAKTGKIGSAGSVGICHSYAPDGRCISLLKILMTNACIYDCHFCINRRSSDIRRARMSTREIVDLTLNFYKRNYIEGLFLSSGIIRDADYTMEQLVRVARELREVHEFRGYIHLKSIPEASSELLRQAGVFADRVSINIELPSQESLTRFAPEKNLQRTEGSMQTIRGFIDEHQYDRRTRTSRQSTQRTFATGQSTQMIVGADRSSDAEILNRSTKLYGDYKLKRVYYSAFSPIPAASTILPLKSPPLIREHRLYQADWLMRFYGFRANELTEQPESGTAGSGNLDLDLDPKLTWALRNREAYPVDLNAAPKEILLRIPGIGVRGVQRIIEVRRHGKIRLSDLSKLRVNLRSCLPFIITADHRPALYELDQENLRERFAPKPDQKEFSFVAAAQSAHHGEIQ